jgi:predicted nuclease of predicted toxin-antitoxin system
VKLLLDENLSPRLVELLADAFPASTHPTQLGIRGTSDQALWDFARSHGYIIASKHSDFRQRVFLHGPPPKVIWLSAGNAGTAAIADLLRTNIPRIRQFAASVEEGLLVLEMR